MDNWHDLEAAREVERVRAEMATQKQVSAYGRYGDPIDWTAARTIAAHWQSSGRVGSVLASLATGAAFDADALIDDIRQTLAEVEARPQHHEPDDVTELNALLAFALRLDDDECKGEDDAV